MWTKAAVGLGLALATQTISADACETARETAPPQFARPSGRDLTVGFGLQMHPLLRVEKQHTGLDFAGPIGDPVRAAEAGEVIEAIYKGQYGNHVVIRHAGGVLTTYSHLARFAVKEGDCIAQGHVIGQMGNTGLSTEPHLHFEVLKDGVYVDPAPLLLPVSGR